MLGPVQNGQDQIQQLLQPIANGNLNEPQNRAYNLRVRGCAALAIGLVFGAGAFRSSLYACATVVDYLRNYEIAASDVSDVSYSCKVGIVTGVTAGVFVTLGGAACFKRWAEARNIARIAQG